MERRLHKCPICMEWFNTTSAVMIDHYREKHPQHFSEMVKAAELALKRALCLDALLEELDQLDRTTPPPPA